MKVKYIQIIGYDDITRRYDVRIVDEKEECVVTGHIGEDKFVRGKAIEYAYEILNG